MGGWVGDVPRRVGIRREGDGEPPPSLLYLLLLLLLSEPGQWKEDERAQEETSGDRILRTLIFLGRIWLVCLVGGWVGG